MLSATKNSATSKNIKPTAAGCLGLGQTDRLQQHLMPHYGGDIITTVGTGNWKLQGFCCSKVLMSALADSDWEKATLFPSTVLFTPFLCKIHTYSFITSCQTQPYSVIFKNKTAITPILAIIHYNSLKIPRERVRVTQHQKWNGKNMKLIPRRSLEAWV